uniref:DUF547 domain-containing protein n=1 Tax=Kalanchoe fedtschenkoi TaxID=63787 RepID=A0A7N0TXW2_KALFE
MLPLHVKVLLAELAVVEEEISLLERKVRELKQHVDQEKHITNKWEKKKQQMQNEKKTPLRGGPTDLRCFSDLDSKKDVRRSYRIIRDRNKCLTSSDMSNKSTGLDDMWTDDMMEQSRILESQSLNQRQFRREIRSQKPNDLSEQLIKCLIDMFLKMNQSSCMDCQGSNAIPKLNIPCVNSSFNCKSSALPSNDTTSKTSFDPYGVLSDIDAAARDIGPYNKFTPITRGSFDVSRSLHPSNGNLRVLLYKLSHVDLTHLGYKQKLAFWINIYNACVMHAFLQHGLPSSHDNLLSLMKKATLNVGGIVLNALAMEHFILRHPCESTAHSNVDDEDEMVLRQAYGLGYPEPNITFALCRGSWSSPALRVYTAEDVVNELGRARVEYLEAAIGITSKKRIVVPKLLEWHMKDFADDMESLLEWIYSHTPRNGPLKRLIMEYLNGNGGTKFHTTDKVVVIQPYESEFRYLIHV